MKTLMLLIALGVVYGARKKWFPLRSTVVWHGVWGRWGRTEYCHGDYAVQFKVRVEGSVHQFDDTAMNSVCLICQNGREICSSVGYWGGWYKSGYCRSGYTGGKFRFEHPVDGDDTAGNTLLLNCGTGSNYVGAKGAPDNWGLWSTQSCPYGTRICGLQTRVEGRLTNYGDDTALNGIRFVCCATVVRVTASLLTLYHGDGGSGSSSYTKIIRKIVTGVSSTTRLDSTESHKIAAHVGLSVSYGGVTGDASLDVEYLKETFRSTINTRSENRTDIREFLIYLKEPTYFYQAQSVIVMSDGSKISQGADFVIHRSTPFNNTEFVLYED